MSFYQQMIPFGPTMCWNERMDKISEISQYPDNNAGPNVQAGFIPAFVSGIPTRWVRKTVPPMARAPIPGAAFLCTAAMNMTSTKKNVSRASTRKPLAITIVNYILRTHMDTKVYFFGKFWPKLL